MQLTKILLITTVILIVTVNCVFGHKRSSHLGIETEQDRDTAGQAERIYTDVLNHLLPSGEIAPEKFPKDVKWMVTVRILPPFEKPEYRFSMRKIYNGKVEVSVITPKGTSILSQLRTLQSKYPNASLEQISGFISIEQWTVTQLDHSQLSRLADEFEAIKISPVLPNELRMDGTGYEFWSQSLWGNRMNVILEGPGSNAKKQPHPLLQWAETVRNSIGLSSNR
jgi:hypothetical protein